MLRFGETKKQLLKNPFVFLSKKTMTIKVHYDMYHGYGELDKAIELAEKIWLDIAEKMEHQKKN